MALEPHVEDVHKSAIISKYPKFLSNHHAVPFLTDSLILIRTSGCVFQPPVNLRPVRGRPAVQCASGRVVPTAARPLLQETPAARADGEYAPLVTAAAAGDREALEALLMRAQQVAYRFSVAVCGAEDAEDVMQDALIKTFRHVRRIRNPRAFRPWLYRTVRNACLMRHRRRVDEPARLASLDELLPTEDGLRPIDVPDPGRDPEAIVVNGRLRKRLRQALRSLPSSFRLIVFLREMEGLSTREVAKITGLSEANVKTRLHRARLHLQHALGDAR